jgi:thiosulfate/3-mercaptopyruvate sulfurtransferase
MTVPVSPLVTPETLHAELSGSHAPLVIDARPVDRLWDGLIGGSVHLDVWGMSLIDTSEAPLRAFSWMVGHLFALRGVDPGRPVVVYEQDSGVRAARVLWLLDYLGHPHARMLDGGFAAWREAGFAVAHRPATPVAGTWHGAPTAERVATWSRVLDDLGRPGVVIVDTRSREEYLGRLVRAARGGAIPGAVPLEWKDNLTADGRFKPAADLRAMYAASGVTPDKHVITYCQGGYRAAHAYVALRHLGFRNVRNYLGSWKEWGDREDLPIERPGDGPPPVE